MSTIPAAYDSTPLTTVENTAFPTSEPRGDSPWSPVRGPSAHGPVEGPPLLDLEPGRNVTYVLGLAAAASQGHAATGRCAINERVNVVRFRLISRRISETGCKVYADIPGGSPFSGKKGSNELGSCGNTVLLLREH